MTSKGPTYTLNKLFNSWLTYIVQQCGPSKPKIFRSAAEVIHDLKGMVEVVLVELPFNLLNPL
jgi:hypothetical protein